MDKILINHGMTFIIDELLGPAAAVCYIESARGDSFSFRKLRSLRHATLLCDPCLEKARVAGNG